MFCNRWEVREREVGGERKRGGNMLVCFFLGVG